jgi:hypothetical protein
MYIRYTFFVFKCLLPDPLYAGKIVKAFQKKNIYLQILLVLHHFVMPFQVYRSKGGGMTGRKLLQEGNRQPAIE